MRHLFLSFLSACLLSGAALQAEESFCEQPQSTPCWDTCNTFYSCGCDDCCDFFVSADFLYWQLNSDCFNFLSVRDVCYDEGYHTSSDCTHSTHFGWDPGFRIGAGFQTCFCDLVLATEWTHFNTSGSRCVLLTGLDEPCYRSFALLQMPEVCGDLSEGQFARFKAKGRFDYDIVDLTASSSCCLCEGVSIVPFIGLRFADIEHKLGVDFEWDDNFIVRGGGDGPRLTKGSCDSKNHFTGVGLLIGGEIDYNCFCCFTLFGRGDFAYAWGRNRQCFKDRVSYDEDYEFWGKHSKRNTTGIGFLDAAIGLRYEIELCGCFPLTVEAAWEQHYLFDVYRGHTDGSALSEFANSEIDCCRGNLMLSGFTLGAEICF